MNREKANLELEVIVLIIWSEDNEWPEPDKNMHHEGKEDNTFYQITKITNKHFYKIKLPGLVNGVYHTCLETF